MTTKCCAYVGHSHNRHLRAVHTRIGRITSHLRRDQETLNFGEPNESAKVKQLKYSVVIERDEDGLYVASIPELPGCHTQAMSLDEVTSRIKEAAELYLEATGFEATKTEFVGIQILEVSPHEP